MRTTSIGSLEVSAVGLGCNNFGRALDLEGARVVVDAALEAGVTYFDTAANYGNGQSESFLGTALGARRRDVIIATKFGMPRPDEAHGGASPAYLRASVERSLRDLGTDVIDLYQLHKPDPDVPIAETLGALAELVEQGMVREIGCSNLDVAQMSEAQDASRSEGWPLFCSNQIEYSLIHRAPERDGMAALCQANGIALLPFYPLANGLLTGKARPGAIPPGRLRMDRYQEYLTDRNFEIAAAVARFAAERDLAAVQVAIGWLLAQPTVPAVTPGATRPEQVRVNASAHSWAPTVEELAILDDLAADVP